MDCLDAVTMLTTTWFDNILLKSLKDLEGYLVIVQCGRGLMQSMELIVQGLLLPPY